MNVDDGYRLGDRGLPEDTKYDTDFASMTVEEAEEIKRVLRQKKKKKRKKRGFLSMFK